MDNVSQTAAQPPVSLDTPKIATVSPQQGGAASKAAGVPSLQVETADKASPLASGDRVGQVPKLDPQSTKQLPGQLERTLEAVNKLVFTHGLDLTAILSLIIVSETKIYKAERQERAAHLTTQLSYLLKKAQSLEDEGMDQLIGGVVKGALEIGSGLVRGVGAAKSAKSLKADSTKLTPQEMAAKAQSVQMRFGAVADTVTASGDIAGSTTAYLAKQEESTQTKYDAQAQFAASQVSFNSESAGRYWGMLQSVISTLQESIQGNHQAVEASFY